MKVYKTKNVDEVIDGLERDKLPGVPSKAEILHLSIGESFIKTYKEIIDLYPNSFIIFILMIELTKSPGRPALKIIVSSEYNHQSGMIRKNDTSDNGLSLTVCNRVFNN